MSTSTASDDNSYRLSFYGKVGFRCVAHHSLDAILLGDANQEAEPSYQDGLVCLTRVRSFCRVDTVASHLRSRVWQLLLGVEPCDGTLNARAHTCQQQIFSDTLQTVDLLVRLSAANDSSVETAVSGCQDKLTPAGSWLGWLVNSGQLMAEQCGWKRVLEVLEQPPPQTRICDVVCGVVCDGAWCQFAVLSALWSLQQKALQQLHQHAATVAATVDSLLTRCDSALAGHLGEVGVLSCGHVERLMIRHLSSFFLDVLPAETLERMLDKFIVNFLGASTVLMTALLVTSRHQLLQSGQVPVELTVPPHAASSAAKVALQIWSDCAGVPF